MSFVLETGFVSLLSTSSVLFLSSFEGFSAVTTSFKLPHPAKKRNISSSRFFFSSPNTFPTCPLHLFKIDGWSINNVKSNVPLLTVFVYVYISSPLPINELAFQLTLTFSENFSGVFLSLK